MSPEFDISATLFIYALAALCIAISIFSYLKIKSALQEKISLQNLLVEKSHANSKTNENLFAANEELIAINEELDQSQKTLQKLNLELEEHVASRTNALSEKNLELQSALKEFEFLANSVPSVVWTAKPNGELDYINNRWYDHSNRSMEGTLGTGWANSVHPDDVKIAWAAWSHSLETGNPYQVEFRVLDKTNQYRWYLVRALALKNETGEIIKWYGTNTDINEQKELARQKDDFLGIASHELKTPVTSLKAYAQLMEAKFLVSGDTLNAGLAAKMNKQVNRLTSLISDLLDVTKINSGRLQFNESNFDFNQLVEEVIEEIGQTTSKHQIKADLKFEGQIAGDRERISQVVVNLLTNAIKYSPDENLIVVNTEKKDNELQLCVQDFGIGISSDKQDHVFEQFYRVSGKKEHTFPGLGLGLYISSEIVKRLDGKIWVNSVEGKGSTFCFSLPLKELN